MDYSAKEDIIEYLLDRTKYLILPSEQNNYESKFIQSNILLYCVVFLLIFKIVSVSIYINIPQNIFFADITKTALESFANQTRQSLGLVPLVENQKLNEAAKLKAEDMVLNQYFSHTSPTGITPWFWFSKAGYNYKYAGENLAIGFFDSQEVYNAWLNSPSHKANLLNPNYKEVGTAVLNGYGQNNTFVVVQLFGSLPPVKSVVADDNATKPVTKPNEPVQTTEPSETAPVSIVKEKVLSQSTELNTIFEEIKTSGKNDFYSRFLNFVLYNYSDLLQSAIYGVSLVVIGILFALILFNINFGFKKNLVLRSVLIVILLSSAMLLNKELIISIIPHQIII